MKDTDFSSHNGHEPEVHYHEYEPNGTGGTPSRGKGKPFGFDPEGVENAMEKAAEEGQEAEQTAEDYEIACEVCESIEVFSAFIE